MSILVKELENTITKNNLKFRSGAHQSMTGWQLEFNKLNDDSGSFVISSNHSDKNRYDDVLANDHSLVRLKSSYINANWIDEQRYIATQGPLPNTVNDFWEMIWIHNMSTIIMLTPFIENNKIKCHQYWSDDYSYNLTDYIVSTLSIKRDHHIVTRTFAVLHKVLHFKRIVMHYHLEEWPDFGVPDLTSFNELIKMVPREGLVVHCSGGIGRTATFITVHHFYHFNDHFNIIEFVINMRKDRARMLQSKEQLKFCYEALVKLIA